MEADTDKSLQIYQATLRVVSGWPKDRSVDTLFFHGRSYGDDTGLFQLAGELYHGGQTNSVSIFGNNGERVNSTLPFEANPGRDYYYKRLLTEGIPAGRIFFNEPGDTNTRIENKHFLDLSKEKRWTSGAILTLPHQLLRAMLGMINEMQRQNHWLYVYTATPRSTPWFEVVKGSQGLEEKSRLDHIKDEHDRIFAYIAKGDLATFTEFDQYLERREKYLI